MRKQRPSFLKFKSPWWFDSGDIRLPSPPDGLSIEEVRQLLKDGELIQPYIIDTDFERRLHFTRDAVQSIMSLDQPDALVVAYTRKMMAFLLFNPNPNHIVMVGLGGGSMSKFCYRHLTNTQITVVEIDADIIGLREQFCVPPDDHRFRIVHDDGADYITTLTEPVDVILVDAFDPIGIAPSLADSDFYAQAASRLSPNGVLVMNLSGERARYAPHIDRICAAFDGSTIMVPVIADDNDLLFAFKKKIVLTDTDEYSARAHDLQSALDLEFPRYWDRICDGEVLA